MTTHVTRRAMLATPVVVYPTFARPSNRADSEILRLFDRHLEITSRAAHHRCQEADQDAELDRLFYNEADRIERNMMALPSRTPAEMAAKMIVAHCHDLSHTNLLHDNPVWIEARRLVS